MNHIPHLPGYSITELLYAGSRTLVYRGVRESDDWKVVLKLLQNPYPNFNELLQFRNQYTIVKNINLPSIVKMLALAPYGNAYALVMEDYGGISLKELLQQQGNLSDAPQSLTAFLQIAIQITEALDGLYRHRVIHKDIKPANILIHPETKQVKLIDFSIASLLPRETQEIQNANVLEGTLAYLAPEQTGRMNRGIDYRSDFYSLGVTFYELLTGQLPFVCDDAMELVHCHLAKSPILVHQINANIPLVLSLIVSKLMAKNAEERYQSALGIKHDLEICLHQLQETGRIEAFELGQRDVSDRFIIPEKLYGRESEVKTLLDAFNRVADGSSELMLVAGFSGIGKTAVVNEVHKPIVRQRGYFIKGKFDQFNRNIPLSAFVQALRDFMGQLLSESDEQLAQWQAKILAAVGENGQVLIDVIPELEQIIGKQAIAPELSGSAAQNRFNLLFQKFIEVFTTADHPLVMFLDDLQWADLASLQLLKLLMNDNGYLLLLGAYRNNEVSPVHPFIMTVAELQKAQTIVNTITLKPLAFEDTNHLVADTLNCLQELAQPLTELIDRKTQGNPFFTTQFLKALHDDGYIRFDRVGGASQNENRRHWECDLAQVNALSLTDNVVEFMAMQLQKLLTETQQVLKLAACIGNQFDLATLAIVSERSPTDTATALWKALQEGLILPTSQSYKFFQSKDSEPSNAQEIVNPTYRFLHDRVQQAAYSLIPDDQKQVTHYYIGQLLLNNLSEIEQSDKLFDIVNHINLGQSLLKQNDEKEKVARLNLAAAQKAITSTAYATAIQYAEMGLTLLEEAAWNNQYDLMFKLYRNLCIAQLSNASYEQLSATIAIALAHISAPVERAEMYGFQVIQYTVQGDYEKAIQIGLIGLRELGLEIDTENLTALFHEEFSAVAQVMEAHSISSLLDLPIASDPVIQAVIKLLMTLEAPAYITANIELHGFNALRAVRLSIKHGNIAESVFAYAVYGFHLGVMKGQYQQGYEFADLAVQLSHKLNDKSQQCQAAFLLGSFIHVWAKPIAGVAAINHEGFLAGMESGEIQFAAYNLVGNICNQMLQGENLIVIAEDIEKYWSVAERLQEEVLRVVLAGARIFVKKLSSGQVQEDDSSIAQAEAIIRQGEIAQTLLAVCIDYFLEMRLACITTNFEQGYHYFIKAGKILNAAVGFTTYSDYYYCGALILLNLYSGLSQAEQSQALEQIQSHQERLKAWSDSCPENFLHKYLLVEAERCRVLGNQTAAIDLYDRAIAGAKTNGYIQEAALANELAAKFYLDWGKEKIAQEYLIDAYYGYAHWGAKAKVQDLEHRYPQLLAPILQQRQMSLSATETVFATTALGTSQAAGKQSSSSGSTSISATLDLATILKASQTLSSEIELDKLLATLLHTVLENAGADKGALLMPRDNQWFVEAIATIDQPVRVQSIALSSSSEIPQSLINTVKRSREPVVIVDASVHPTLAMDSYVVAQQPKSLLCTPILNQGKLVGILYLENQVSVGAFTRDRVELLNFLCAQAAISLENAQLYQDLQHSERSEREKAEELEQTLAALQLKNHTLAFRADVDAALTRTDSLANMLQSCTEAVVQYLGAAFARIWTLNTDENVLELQASAGLYTHLDGPHSRVPVGQFKIGLIAQEHCPHLTNDVLNDPRVGNKVWAQQEGMIAFAGYPLMLEDQLVGVMAMFARQELSDETLDMLQLVADEIASGIKRKQVEQALQASELQLQQKAGQLEQAFQQLQQSQLQVVQSEKMASLGNLVAGVAHEINNPIGFLNGSINNAKEFVQELLDYVALYQQHHPNAAAPVQDKAEEIDLEFLREDLPKLLGAMKGATDRIKGISTSLRTFSRADTEHKVSANLHDGIDSTLLILKYRLKANEYRPAIEVIQDYGDLPLVDCFPGQLNQVFMNILANAIDMFDELAQHQSFAELKAHPQQITIRTTADSNQVQIQISDNGKGMTEDVQARIFDHLFTTKSVGKGTGLGLAIARQIIVEKHGGAIDVNSEVGKGTEFVLTLPIC